MSRRIRVFGSSGYLHVIKRGINHQDIFLDEQDFRFFLKTLRCLRDEMGFTVVAYCLMSNHFHLLLHDDKGEFSTIMQRLSTKYAMYYNRKYERTGALFEGRFVSKGIDSEQYLLTVVRYIHNNPVKGGICLAKDYRWSSYSEYVSEHSDRVCLCDTSVVLEMFNGKERFEEFHNAELSIQAFGQIIEMERIEGNTKTSDEDLLALIQTMTDSSKPFQLQHVNKTTRNEVIHRLKKMGIKSSQIMRVTGVSKGIIRRA